MKNLFLLGALLLLLTPAKTQFFLETTREKILINPDGTIREILLKNSTDTIRFRQDQWKGPVIEGVNLEKAKPFTYEGQKEGISYQIRYEIKADIFMISVNLKNNTDSVFMPERVRLILGLDTYMEKFPDWNTVYFPTLLRAERTHFWGYFMTPHGKILTLASADPVASWANNYEQYPSKHQEKMGYFGEHRIYTVSLDLLHRLPLPGRFPQHLFRLQPNGDYQFRFSLKSLDVLNDVKPMAALLTRAPLLDAAYYTVPENEKFSGKIYGEGDFRMEIKTPRNEMYTVTSVRIGKNVSEWEFIPQSGCGIYQVMLYSATGKISESSLYVRPGLDFYLKSARKEALRSQPTATHHAECFYPLYTYFLARQYVPDTLEDCKAEEVFTSIYLRLFDDSVKEMRNGKYRIQDAATMAGVLADRYQVTRNEKDLEDAAGLVDFLLRCQGDDGAYYNPGHKVHYTSVIYIAKSIMEVMNEEKKMAGKDKRWKENYKRHLNSVRRAMDDLAKNEDNIQTEGQMTFEDGMISCSVTQLAMAALKETDAGKKAWYLEKARKLDEKHRCLTQLLVPDCRMNGATLRFWEYQYTINLLSNAMNSPCGWSAWKIYGSWYLYLLTGDYAYLNETFNALGSCLQLLDLNTGELRFSFMPDPFTDTYQYMEIPVGSGTPVVERVVVGEQYLSQISSWHREPQAAWRKKWGIDNFAHEVFKCMTEVALTNAYLLETEREGVKGINCVVTKEGNTLVVRTNEKLVRHLHVNLKNNYTVKVVFQEDKVYKNVTGLKWLGQQPDGLTSF